MPLGVSKNVGNARNNKLKLLKICFQLDTNNSWRRKLH